MFPEPETMKNNDEQTSQKPICLCCTTSSWSPGLGCGWQYLSWLLSTHLGLGWAWVCLSWLFAALIPQHSPVLSCVCHLELCSSRGKGKDGQQWEKEGGCRAGPGNFPSEENGIKWCPFQVCSPLLPPEAMPQG